MNQTDQILRPVQVVFWLALGLAMLLFTAKPIGDPDFWWHLHSGRQMWDQGWLVDTSALQGSSKARADLILHGYWLWDIVAFFSFKSLGYWGVLLLKAFTMFAVVWTVLWRMLKLHIKHGVMMLVCTLGFVIFGKCYYLERPQIFSFIFAAVLLGIFEQVREKERLNPLLIPLMVVWGNVHGGVVVGDLLLLLFSAGMAWEWRKRKRDLFYLLLWVTGGIAGSLLQPSTFRLFSVFFDFNNDRLVYSLIAEYASTLTLFLRKEHAVAGLWLLMAIHAIGIMTDKNKWLPDVLIFGFLAAFSTQYSRNIGFFAIALLPATAFYVDRIFSSEKILKILIIFSTISSIFLTAQGIRNTQFSIVSDSYPNKLTEFLKENKIHGNMLNDYAWGGYLLWKLYPNYHPLLDGRVLDFEVFKRYMSIMQSDLRRHNINTDELEILTTYDIDFIVFSNSKFMQSVFPFTTKLIESYNWIPVYSDSNGYILVKPSDKNSEIMNKFAIKKDTLYANILNSLNDKIQTYPSEDSYISARSAILDHLEYIGHPAAGTVSHGLPGDSR